MALQIQIPYKGSDYLYQGISGAGQGIGAGIEKMTANLKKAKAYKTMAIDALGMDPEQVDKMGLAELEGHFQAVAVKNAMAQAQERQQRLAMDRQHMEMEQQGFPLLQAQRQAQIAEIMAAGADRHRRTDMEEQGLPTLLGERAARVAELNAMAEERKAKTQLAGDEAEAWPQLMQAIMEGRHSAAPMPQGNPDAEAGGAMAPAPEEMMGAAAAGMGPTTQSTRFSPEELMAGMARMGKTSPKLSAALSRVLIPQLMQGATASGPQPWKSPEGNPYVWMGHTMMPDRPGLDLNSIMGQTPEGFTAVPSGNNKVQYLKTEKTLPTEFHSTLDKIGEDIASANATLEQPDSAFVDGSGKPQSADYIKTMRGYATKRLGLAQKRGQATIDRYHSTGYLTDEQRQEMYGELGLTAAAKGKGKATEAPGAKPNTQALIDEANKAIQAGADPAAVKKRLKDKYNIDVK